MWSYFLHSLCHTCFLCVTSAHTIFWSGSVSRACVCRCCYFSLRKSSMEVKGQSTFCLRGCENQIWILSYSVTGAFYSYLSCNTHFISFATCSHYANTHSSRHVRVSFLSVWAHSTSWQNALLDERADKN
jgi:hypothetical protein